MKPYSLRGWLRHLAATERIAVAAIAKRLDGRQATQFPRPGGHEVPVVSVNG